MLCGFGGSKSLSKQRVRQLLLWVPLLLWLVAETCLLAAALSESCTLQSDGNRHEAFLMMFFWGYPSSIPVALISDDLPDPCTMGGCIVLWLVYCVAGLVQWYFVLRGLEWFSTRLYRGLRAIRRSTAG